MEKTKMPTNLSRRGATYYARVSVPLEYQALIGKREIWKSLGTKDINKARQLLPHKMVEIQSQWLQLNEEEQQLQNLSKIAVHKLQQEKKPIDAQIITFIAKMIFDQDLREDESERQSLSSLDQLLHESEINTPNLEQLVDSAMVSDTALNDENFDKYHKQRSIKKTILKTVLRNNDPRPVLDLTDAMAMMFDLDIGTDEAYEKFANAIIRAKLAAIEEMEARDIGKIDARPSDPIVTTFLEQYAKPGSDCIFNASLKNTHEDIMALHGQYVDDNPKGIGQDSLNQNRKSILLFLDSIGKNPFLGDFNRTKVREWRNLLKVFPVRT